MRYLITTNNHEPFLTKWFDPENHFNKELDMLVYDFFYMAYTKDGVTWLEIPEDHL